MGLEELRDHLGAAVLQEGSARIEVRTLLVLDLWDIAKPYAEKMEDLARARDGSTGGLANGYWLCQVIGVENEDSAVMPLYSALYSQRAPDFQSENEEIKTALSEVAAAGRQRERCTLRTRIVAIIGLGKLGSGGLAANPGQYSLAPWPELPGGP